MDTNRWDQTSIRDFLRHTIPFRFLEPGILDWFLTFSRIEAFEKDHVFMRQGDDQDRLCYVLLSGSVEVFDDRQGIRVSTIEPAHYFGEWEAIFDVPRVYTICGLVATECLIFEGTTFIDLIDKSLAFVQALSGILRERQGIFRAFELFDAELTRGIGYGHISIQKLLPLYQALNPALHPLVNTSDKLDFRALDYAVRRLPRNLTSTFAFLIRDELPAVYEDPDSFFPVILTEARRRSIWEVLPGKNLMLTRSGVSDIRDFITCLCLYATEARKIRKHIYAVKGVKRIREFLRNAGDKTGSESLLSDLRFSKEDSEGMLKVWPKDLISRLWEIVNHREMYSVDIRTRQSSYNLRDFAQWSDQIGEAAKELIGYDPAELPDEVEVHIISSNTHSVSNCLNPWFADNHHKIMAWARDTRHPYIGEEWDFDADCLYALSRDYFKAFPHMEQEMLAAERLYGILRLEATASTGIEVQVIDLQKIRNKRIDPILSQLAHTKPMVIVNIDYAFGEQAQFIIHQLILLFGRTIRSVNLLGKAGSLVGHRGDILIPSAFIEQSHDLFSPVRLPAEEEIDALTRLAGPRDIHCGPMLTVKGTLMQNRLMLHFYHHLWKAKGIEMEGIYYHRQVIESLQTGLLRPDLISRFYYYVSDLPLDSGDNLSERLKASEGVPPLYAITRQILGGILGQSS